MVNPFKYFVEEVEREFGVTLKKQYGHGTDKERLVRQAIVFILYHIDGLTYMKIGQLAHVGWSGVCMIIWRSIGLYKKQDEEFMKYYTRILEIHNSSLYKYLRYTEDRFLSKVHT